MYFETMQELELWLIKHKKDLLDNGAQGECYKIGNKVFKIFLQYIDKEVDWVVEYSREEIMQFSSITNKTYIFPTDVIMVGNIVVGYITNYVDAKSLYQINPLCINLDKLEVALEKVVPDIKKISDNGVLSYDVMYNILYGIDGFSVIDTLDYARSELDSHHLYLENYDRFIHEIRLFLINGIFDKFITSNPELYNLCYDREANFVDFMKNFRMKLSENEGMEISRLKDAKRSISFSRRRDCKYIRNISM